MSQERNAARNPDPLVQRPASDQGDTAVPAEGDVAQQPQTVDEDFRPPQNDK